MKIKSAIIVVTAVLVVFATVAMVGSHRTESPGRWHLRDGSGFCSVDGSNQQRSSQAAELELSVVSGRPFFHEKQSPEI